MTQKETDRERDKEVEEGEEEEEEEEKEEERKKKKKTGYDDCACVHGIMFIYCRMGNSKLVLKPASISCC